MLAPGDPGRALRLAQALTDKPLMVNHARGLWGYTGTAADGAPLTIQSTGLGGASTAAVVRDLAVLGARRIVRVGTCAAVAPELELGSLLSAHTVLAADGTSRALGASERLQPTLAMAGLPGILLASLDLDDAPAPPGAQARDLTSAALLAAAASFGLAAGVAVLVALDTTGNRLDDEALHTAEITLGRAALKGSGLGTGQKVPEQDVSGAETRPL